jgi:hypothetical protein
MTIKKMQDKAFANALKHGFHHKGQNIGEMLMLIVSELGEALEADRRPADTPPSSRFAGYGGSNEVAYTIHCSSSGIHLLELLRTRGRRGLILDHSTLRCEAVGGVYTWRKLWNLTRTRF